VEPEGFPKKSFEEGFRRPFRRRREKGQAVKTGGTEDR